MPRKKAAVETPSTNGAHAQPRVLSSKITMTELAEFKARKALFDHQYQVLQAVELRYRLYQKQIKEAYGLPDEFNVNMETGEITWKAQPLEVMASEGRLPMEGFRG